MQPPSTSAVLLLALAALAATTTNATRVVPVRIHKQAAAGGTTATTTDGLPARLVRRAPFDENLANNLTVGAYFAEVEIGTPGQTLALHVDTGSTEVWLLSPRTDLCRNGAMQVLYGSCKDQFDDRMSSSFKLVSGQEFEIRYMDGSSAAGEYFTDHINIGGLSIQNLQMGLALEATSSWGMLGIGYTKNTTTRKPFPSIVDQMFNQGLIGIKAYSLYLNDVEASTGTILFGGIDTEKFYGVLKSTPTLPDDDVGRITHFNVSLTSLTTVSVDTGTEEFLTHPVPVILDSGTTLTYLPRTVTGPLFDKLNAYDRSSATYPVVYVDCAIRDMDPSLVLSYRFAGAAGAEGPVINVSIADIIFDDVMPYVRAGFLTLPSKLPFPRDRVCSLGVLTSGLAEPHILGDSFLRSAYVVYDLTNHHISLAQSNMNSTKENIIEIPKGAKTVPLATGQPMPVSTFKPKNGAVVNRGEGRLLWTVMMLVGMLCW